MFEIDITVKRLKKSFVFKIPKKYLENEGVARGDELKIIAMRK